MYAVIRPTTTSSPTSVRWTPHRQRRSVPRSTRSQLNCALQPDYLRLRPALQAQRGPCCTSQPALCVPPDIPQWRVGRPACLATRVRRPAGEFGMCLCFFSQDNNNIGSRRFGLGLAAPTLNRYSRIMPMRTHAHRSPSPTHN